MPSATIKLLPHGDPKRLRVAEISNWSGKAVAAPRVDFDALLDREEMGQSGVYVLTGSDPETRNPMAHIGEEIRNPMASQIDAAIKSALVYETEGKEKK